MINNGEVPNELKRDITKLKEEFSRLKMQTKWPVIDKGYYEYSLSVISRIKAVLRQPVSTKKDDGNGQLSNAVQVVYQALNHIYRFDLQTTQTSRWLFDALEDSDVQQSLYVHVLSNEGFSHRDVIEMKLLKEFNLKARLGKEEQDLLTKGKILFGLFGSVLLYFVFSIIFFDKLLIHVQFP